MAFLRWLFSNGNDAAHVFSDRDEVHAVAAAARARLSQLGRLQVELDAQKAIRASVEFGSVGPNARRGLSKQPKSQLPTAAEQARVSYPDIRDRFLAQSDTGEYSEWLVEVGRYVHDRWLAEERLRVAGQPLDEDASKHLWDECSERELVRLRSEALVGLGGYRRRKLFLDLREAATGDSAPLAARVLTWITKTMLEGFVGGIGLVVLGLLFVWLAPHIVKDIRGAFDDALPEATSPHQLPCPAGATHQTDPTHC